MTDKITGKTLIEWGFEPGKNFPVMIHIANVGREEGYPDSELIETLKKMVPEKPRTIPMRDKPLPWFGFIDAETPDEIANVNSVSAHMNELMRVPTIRYGAIMPDACPSGSAPGTIPVGGVVACEDAIHPGFHSADICCSVAISIFENDVDVSHFLDVAMKTTHFGPGKRSASEVRQNKELLALLETFADNPFLAGLEDVGTHHFMTQGDGNHFLYVGRLEHTGQLALVTHHGSRGLGAKLYKRGKQVAEHYTKRVAPEVPSHNAWIKAESKDGQQYWDSLQTIREWTKMNHFAIHDLIAKRLKLEVADRFWNEHNFVFRRTDGLYYHAKGATPAYRGFAEDDMGFTLIPLNMAEPILITSPGSGYGLEFAPHGAGRNMSRTQHIKRMLANATEEEILLRETKGLDVRFYTGAPDISELPSAYKNAKQLQFQIEHYKLAQVVNRVLPLGSIMAGRVFYTNRKG